MACSGTGVYLELPSGRPKLNLAASRAEQLYLVIFLQDRAAAEHEPGGPAGERDGDLTRALELELRTTKERLQSTLEELETSNEELRSSNEELSSVNEELQSSNEELETSKEELQSINEELRTVNNELSARVEELSRANNDLKNLFANTRVAMLFLDDGFRIMNFTPPAKPLFHLRDHDLGRPLDELAGRIDYQSLKDQVQTVILEGVTVAQEVRTSGDEVQTFRAIKRLSSTMRTLGAPLFTTSSRAMATRACTPPQVARPPCAVSLVRFINYACSTIEP